MKRIFNRHILLLALMVFFPVLMYGQEVFYSPDPGYNAHSVSFEIIGKYNGLRLIYTKNYDNHHITFFDNNMKPVDTLALELPYRTKNVHFIDLRSGFILYYQYEQRRDIICKAVLFDGAGNEIKEPVVIDRLAHPLRVEGDTPLSYVVSEDKSRILAYKIFRQANDDLLKLTTFLLDSNLVVLHKGTVLLPRADEYAAPDQLKLSDQGGLYLVYGARNYSYQPYFENIALYYKPAFADTLFSKRLFFKKHLPRSHVLLSINETTQQLWLNSFNFDERRRHIAALDTRLLEMDDLQILQHSEQLFTLETRKKYAEKKNRRKSVFDRYVPAKIIFNRAGGGLLIAEQHFLNAKDQTLYGNLGFFSLDSAGRLTQFQQIAKEPDQNNYLLSGSFLMLNTGRALHFLLNQEHGATRFLSGSIYLLRDYRYQPDKKLQPLPVMENMDRGYKWLPQMGKQVDRNEVIIPCLSGGKLLFGRIAY